MMFDNSDAHMGHFFLDSMKERPDVICQIDAATGEEETNSSVLRRSIRLAQSFRKLGLAPGDVLVLAGFNHINLHIPYYAAILNGLPIAGMDPLFKLDEIRSFFKVTSPKIAFCEPANYDNFVMAASDLGLSTRVVSFGTGVNSMQELIDGEDAPIDEFELSPTNRPALSLAPIQWISGFFNALCMPLLHQTKIQTSAPATVEHVIDIINKYRPVTVLIGPSIASEILKSSKACDLTCFNSIILTGGKVYTGMLHDIKKRVREDTLVMEAYGQTENLGPVFSPNPRGPIGGCGKLRTGEQVKLVDPETGIEITEPDVTGELWTKCFSFTEYYNNPEETARAFTEDGWYKTGDLLYRDEDNNYFFVERLKMLIKYRNYHIVPPEVEEVILSHEGVHEVSVTSVPHERDGEHAVACIVTRPGCTVSAQHIKDLVAEKLSETKQLRGGVVFMDKLPMTSAGKVARAKLRQIVAKAYRE